MIESSIIYTYKYESYNFIPYIGYCVESPYSWIMGSFSNIKSYINYPTPGTERKEAYDKANSYFETLQALNSNKHILNHDDLNIPNQELGEVERFCLTTERFTKPKWFKRITLNAGERKESFKYVPFQRFMLLEFIHQMISRSGLEQYRTLIMMKLKEIFGLYWLSYKKCEELNHFFTKTISVHIIPRRHGKTTFAHTLMGISLFYPTANIKTLYCAHESSLPTEAFLTVRSLLENLANSFNELEESCYEIRRREKVTDDFYYKVIYNSTTMTKTLECMFYKWNHSGIINPNNPSTYNKVVCKVYKNKNTFRGSTFNVIIIDECNFLPQHIYNEIIPMTNTDNGRMILMSSQKSGKDKRDIIDLDTTRSKHILFNRVNYVCAPHIKAILKNNTNLIKCPCYYFLPPIHITMDAGYREILNLFTINNPDCKNPDSISESKTALLAEIGVLSTNDISLIKGDLTVTPLASAKANFYMATNLFDMHEYLEGIYKNKLLISKTIITYLDPAPCDVESSYNALSYITEVFDSDEECSHYILLGVEHFKTSDVDPESGDVALACVKLLLANLNLICALYDSYFDSLIIAPECNSLSLEPLRYHLANHFFKTDLCKKMTIQFTSVATVNGQNTMNPVQNESLTDHPRIKQRKVSSYRIGYILSSKNKNLNCVNFYHSVYNQCHMQCARKLLSCSLNNIDASVVQYIINQLNTMQFTKKRSTGAYSISGKKQNQRDDLAISIIMGTCILKDLKKKTNSLPLIALQPISSCNSIHSHIDVGYREENDNGSIDHVFLRPLEPPSFIIPPKLRSYTQ